MIGQTEHHPWQRECKKLSRLVGYSPDGAANKVDEQQSRQSRHGLGHACGYQLRLSHNNFSRAFAGFAGSSLPVSSRALAFRALLRLGYAHRYIVCCKRRGVYHQIRSCELKNYGACIFRNADRSVWKRNEASSRKRYYETHLIDEVRGTGCPR